MSAVVNLLERPVYGFGQADSILGLKTGTARRWIDGYDRGGRRYLPVVRQTRTGVDLITWGEFVEARLLAQFRESGVPMLRMRPVIERLREEFDTPYPLATAGALLETSGKEIVRRVQVDLGLEEQLQLVVVRTGQTVLQWTQPVAAFQRSLSWGGRGAKRLVVSLQPDLEVVNVSADPLRSSGAPTVRGVRTEIIAELFRAGDSLEEIAASYGLSKAEVDAAVRYELRSRAAA